MRAAFFDVGETLLNEARAWGELARAVDVEPHVVWAALGAVIERGDDHRRVYDVLGVDMPPPGSVGWDARDFYPDALPCLARLRADGYFIGVGGNVGWDIGPFLAAAGAEVDAVTTSFALGAEKPSPEFFARLVALSPADASETAYVGDRVDNDVLPAAASGMVAVHIRRGPWGYLQAGSDRAHVRLRSLDELPAAFDGG